MLQVQMIMEHFCYQHLPKQHKAASCELLLFVSQYLI